MIYCIAEDGDDVGPVKIGFCNGNAFEGEWKRRVSKRLSKLQVGNSRALVVIALCDGTQVQEKALHAMWDGYRIRGEWFRREDAVLDFVNQNITQPIRTGGERRLVRRRETGSATTRASRSLDKALARAWSRRARQVAAEKRQDQTTRCARTIAQTLR